MQQAGFPGATTASRTGTENPPLPYRFALPHLIQYGKTSRKLFHSEPLDTIRNASLPDKPLAISRPDPEQGQLTNETNSCR